jgi:hypothetical protein
MVRGLNILETEIFTKANMLMGFHKGMDSTLGGTEDITKVILNKD